MPAGTGAIIACCCVGSAECAPCPDGECCIHLEMLRAGGYTLFVSGIMDGDAYSIEVTSADIFVDNVNTFELRKGILGDPDKHWRWNWRVPGGSPGDDRILLQHVWVGNASHNAGKFYDRCGNVMDGTPERYDLRDFIGDHFARTSPDGEWTVDDVVFDSPCPEPE